MRRCLSWVPLLFVASIAHADPISVAIIQASYHATLDATIVDLSQSPPAVAQHEAHDLTSTVGLAHTIDLEDPLAMAKAGVSASLFSMTASTSTGRKWWMNGTATSTVGETIDFQPLQTISATLGLSIAGPFDFTMGRLQLTDLSTAAVLWQYVWGDPANTTIPLVSYAAPLITWSVATDLLADRSYRLDLFTTTNSGSGDAHRVTMQVSGFESVADISTPEPSSLLLCLAGVAGAAVQRRRRSPRRH